MNGQWVQFAPILTLPVMDLDSANIFRLFVQSVSDYAIYLLDASGNVVSWNIGAERLKGYKAEEIIGRNFDIFFVPSDRAADKPAHDLMVAKETGRFEDEGWRVRKDGSRFWANVIITRILDEQGKLLGFGKITGDLTQRREAELRYRLLIEGVLDYAIYSMDPEGYITSWNVGGERLKGYKAEEIIGKNFSTFYPEQDRKAGLPAKVLATARASGHFEGEGWRVRKDGSRFWASVVVTPLRDEEGNLYGFSKVTRDVTERKTLHDTLQRHAAELELRIQEREEVNAELEAFAYSVSHDLRAPLRAITGFAEALREDYDDRFDDTGRDFLNQIITAGARMNLLIQDLLEYGRVSRVTLPLENANVLDAVKQAEQQLGNEKLGTFDMAIPRDLEVSAHPQMLSQVLFNLLSNAFKFHAPGSVPEVRVWAETPGHCVRINVRDNGIGIAHQHQDRIWQVFERLHDRTIYPGSGIGLAIVKRAVTRMGGRYGVESEAGKGSTFWIELPRTSNHREEPTHA